MTTPSVASDPTDLQLLGLAQAEVPVTEHPFAKLGEKLKLSEAEVIAHIQQLKADKVIRQISAIFDTRSLGYESSLVAARYPADQVDAAAAIINQHPGVSHNYLRNHTFNLWYTIAVPPTSRLGLVKTVDLLHKISGAESTRLLPTLKLFKIGVQFDVTGESRPDDQVAPPYTEKQRTGLVTLTPVEIEFVRIMQRDLPVKATPFLEYARELGVSFADLQTMHQRFIETGKMRRFSAVLHHRIAGFSANAMGVWPVRTTDNAELDKVGEIMAGFRAVSHCYKRPSYPDWPYNIFTMIHGKSQGECEQTMAAIAEKTGIKDYSALYSTKEYKKVRVKYFTRDEEEWEAGHSQK